MAKRWGNNRNNDTLYFGAPKSLQMVTVAIILKDACSLEELDNILKSRHYFTNKGPSSQTMTLVFPVVMYGCESWTINKAEH